ncbi:hypothetical protein RFI_30459 [Reticulomyxa filosa]|uniref:Cyclic nucleotide-binding domain-containing protein n=1 Tax=Reticulomyxa filosa TaxID=46433 RepID=X6M1U1_RETFI|nr:hypothetical protein RFI_30459 [Reticulomyxa filosa]|eukprot:ETO06935.1 hypothetical protein RFI_30459 [Reticulomyxa filosa]
MELSQSSESENLEKAADVKLKPKNEQQYFSSCNDLRRFSVGGSTELVAFQKRRNDRKSKRPRRNSVSSECIAFVSEAEVATLDSERVPDSIQSFLPKLQKVACDSLVLSGLSKEALLFVAKKFQRVTVKAGEKVSTSLDGKLYFFVIESGTFQVSQDKSVYTVDNEVSSEVHSQPNSLEKRDISSPEWTHEVLTDHGCFGDVTLMHRHKACPCVITASTDGVLWKIDRSSFRNSMIVLRTSQLKAIENALKQCDIFKSFLNKEQLELLAEGVEVTKYHQNDEIIKNKNTIGFYFVISGLVCKHFCVDDNQYHLSKILSEGVYFGELALFEPLSSLDNNKIQVEFSVTAHTPTVQIGHISEHTFARIIDQTTRNNIKQFLYQPPK